MKELLPITMDHNILADTPVVLLGPEQAVEEQDGRRPVRIVRDRLGRLVKVVDQGHGRDRARGAAAAAAAAAVEVICHKRTQAPRPQSSQDGPCAESE